MREGAEIGKGNRRREMGKDGFGGGGVMRLRGRRRSMRCDAGACLVIFGGIRDSECGMPGEGR